ncbi:MAG: DUF2142 domain-containing protein [Anaerolineae bacterium]|nr:DUF2142 domain-containing protein [Anaerolineae bacterium]
MIERLAVRRRLPVVVVLAYIALAVVYSFVTPIGEAPDENFHFAFIEHVIHNDGSLPVIAPTGEPQNPQFSHPPLYYALASLIVRFIPYEPAPLQYNPYAVIGLRPGINYSKYVHTPAEDFPWRGAALAYHLVRLLSIAMCAGAIYTIYRAVQLAVPDNRRVPLLAMAAVAFNPMFLYVSASVNADQLVILMAALASWLIMLIWRRGLTWQRVALLGLVIALGGLGKPSGLTLYVPTAGLLSILWWKRHISLWRAIRAGLILGGVFAVVAGWWYGRNLQLYGSITELPLLVRLGGPHPVPYSVGQFLEEMGLFRISFWGLFGWSNTAALLGWIMALIDGLTVIAVVGGVYWIITAFRERCAERIIPVGLFAFHLVVTFASLVSYAQYVPALQGRLLAAPTFTGIALLLALGWDTVARRIGQRWLAAPVLVLGIASAWTPFLILGPMFAPPPTVASLPASATPIDVRFGNISVVGFHIDPRPIRAGESTTITLYYGGRPDERNLSLFLAVLDRTGKRVGIVDSGPGKGNLPTAIWQPDRLYADTYHIPIATTAAAPTRLNIQLGWWVYGQDSTLLPPTKPDGSTLDALILRGGTLLPAAPVAPPTVVQSASFGGLVRLNGYSLSPADGAIRQGDSINLTLQWEGLKPIPDDLIVFVHYKTADGNFLPGQDAAPLQGDYPTTVWAAGQPFNDPRVLPIKLPPGTYWPAIGLYRAADGQRIQLDSGGDLVILRTPLIVR